MSEIEELIKLNKYCGNYGGSNGSYYALAECIYKKSGNLYIMKKVGLSKFLMFQFISLIYDL